MTIFILEDQVVQAKYLQEITEKMLINLERPDESVQVFYKGQDLLEAAEESLNDDLFLLDIKIKHDDRQGLNIAQTIRKLNPKAVIVFISTYSELALQSFEYMVSALTFIDKNVTAEKFENQLEETLKIYLKQNTELEEERLKVHLTNPPIEVKWSELSYFEVVGNHLIQLNAQKRKVEFYGTLKEIEKLDSRLWRVHQGFVVNQLQIVSFDKANRCVILKPNFQIPVSRTYYRKLKEQLLPFERVKW